MGEQAQVDYGSGPMVRDAQSGKYRRTRLFVLTLGYSRKSVRLLAWRSSARIWAYCALAQAPARHADGAYKGFHRSQCPGLYRWPVFR
jgi:hypothetical protein